MAQKNNTAISLSILAIIELLERLGYYGARSIIVLFAVNSEHLALDDGDALSYYGTISLLIGVMALPMGVLSDFVFKQKAGVLLGSVLLFFGYLLLMSANLFLIGIAMLLIILGTGLFRTNMMVLIGRLFPKTDKKRDAGFFAFYLAINIGAFLGALIIGFSSEEKGYIFGFGVCAAALFLATILFYFTKDTFILRELGEQPPLKYTEVVDSPIFHIPKDVNPQNHNNRLLVLLLLVFVSALFWGIYEIVGNYYYPILYAKENLTLFGVSFTIAFQLFSGLVTLPLLIVMTLVGYFGNLGSSLGKVGIGLLLLSAFGLMVGQIGNIGDDSLIAYSFGAFALVGIAEVLVSPIIMSYVTRLSDVRYASTMVGLLIVIPSLVTKFIGFLETNFEVEAPVYSVSLIALIIGILFLVFRKQLKVEAGGLD
ncbi:MAG: POT family proton-dependent oligopeptide transporter [Paraglaciecola sp.]|jgi:POT family proton-dependent oligopeptide transporter